MKGKNKCAWLGVSLALLPKGFESGTRIVFFNASSATVSSRLFGVGLFQGLLECSAGLKMIYFFWPRDMH